MQELEEALGGACYKRSTKVGKICKLIIIWNCEISIFEFGVEECDNDI